ncbi:MAG: radical SAM protein [Chloroflexota bacterium]
MKIYHIAYEPEFKSLDIHFWTECNLHCRACYTDYEKLDFGLIDDPITGINGKPKESPPTRFLSLADTIMLLKDIDIKRAIFMGTEPALDPELPIMAEALHNKFNCYNIMLTNGLKLIDLEYINEVIFSIKALSEDLHRDYTGKPNKAILGNFIAICKLGKKLQAETVLIPNYIDKYEIERIAGFIADVDINVPLRIDAYFPVGDNLWRAATAREVEAAAGLAKKHLKTVNYLTLDMKRIGEKPVRIF